MQIQTTVSKAALLRLSTNIDATGAEFDRLSALADKLAAQMQPVLASGGGQVLPDGAFALGTLALETPIRLELEAADVNNLTVCCERVTWPFSRMSAPLKTAVQELRHTDLKAWADQAEDEALLARMAPERLKALAEKAVTP